MHDLNQRVQELHRRLENIKKYFNIEDKKKDLSGLEAKSMDPNLWDDQENARRLMQNLDFLKKEIEDYKSMDEEVAALLSLSQENDLSKEFAKDIETLGKRIDKFELKSFLTEAYDAKNAIVSIHAGQGGTEAMDWASMLFRMYLRFCERRNWKTETLDISEGDEAGIKSVTFKVEGAYAYGYLKGEAGTHRLVRQSPFNADKLRQTSFALVEVLPELEETDLPDIQIKDEDLEWQFFRASSQGGQNVQKVSTAVRVIHLPTQVTVTAQTERFQEQNRKIALNLLRSKLWLLEQAREEAQKKDLKGEYRPASWGNQIRSYVLHPYKMVKDLRTEVETADPDAVLDGELDQFIDAEIQNP
ncbi:MAG: Peptide chain release factor 2 [Microgenomates group bacterium GW2011_GWC1_37_8]|uniref:Peptide chain release factor 2 n=1 Tax=Candidatus Woesebacteria bacterium GW2011_GWB1_38_8 TaxID=1618570 RepID=A0A0G0L5H2_9BACT|nr:MAG: Peptide chain release factor 2 [Microgenomates group bacterium GW2011_GWC1_37_8]KKQ86282.1 MAG: Peptide chain release factor 2 [Candidatus Woesebacteria bacterium GW2011_GWB1_38_8]